MPALTQVNQSIPNLQGIKASFVNNTAEIGSGEFDALLASALSNSEAVVGGIPAENPIVMSDSMVVKPTSDFDRFLGMDLLTNDEEISRSARPNLREFMSVTGTSTADSNEMLYGVIGSNADFRDWSLIMASSNPVDAVRAATAQLYGSDLDYQMRSDTRYGELNFAATLSENSLDVATTLGKIDNFALHSKEGITSLMAVSSTGLMLRGAGSSQAQIERTAWLFGFSTEGLGALADEVESSALKDALESFS
jgi:hypothetical protein